MNTAQPRIRLCLEPLEDRLVPSSSPIDLTFATTSDARTISVDYTINDKSLAGSLSSGSEASFTNKNIYI
jgi:hypothetical protein